MEPRQVAIITGASQGIGEAIAMEFARQGLAVALTARREPHLRTVAETISSQTDVPVLVIPADLRKPEDVSRIVQTTIKEWGRIDVLVNNAGVLYMKPIQELTLGEFREMLDVNLTAAFLLSKEVLPHMVSRQGGTIINIASLAGKNGIKTGTGYCASKFGLRGFAASLMQEVREHNIRVITVFPGSVNTPMIGRAPMAPRAESMLQPEDVAHAVYAALSVHPRAMISEIDIRPSNPKRD